jgi:hypothetical protein
MAGPFRIPGVRWGIGVLLGAGVLVNYFHRINLSLARRSCSRNSV